MQSFLDNVLRFEEINNKYNKLCELLTYEEVLLDKKLFLNYQKQKQSLEEIAFIGELSLDGSLRAVNGVLPIVCGLSELGIK